MPEQENVKQKNGAQVKAIDNRLFPDKNSYFTISGINPLCCICSRLASDFCQITKVLVSAIKIKQRGHPNGCFLFLLQIFLSQIACRVLSLLT